MGTSSRAVSSHSLHFATLREAARLIENNRVSPVELTRAMLDRIDTVDARLHSYATVTADRALSAARAAEAEIRSGGYRSPLHGIPIAVKDLFFTEGVRTMGGLKVMADFVPAYDATAVTKLEAAGAVLLGKLSLSEGAMGGYNRAFKIPVNPWRPDLWPGASSSGPGVATAAGLCFASLGTDTGGSIRLPCMANGVVGIKPTYGRVSRHGVLPLSESLDHVGPMTRSVADAAIVLQAIAGADPMDPTSLADPVPNLIEEIERGVRGMRIGFDRQYATEGVDPGLSSAIEMALAELDRQGAEIVDVKVADLSRLFEDIWLPICAVEARAVHAANYPSRVEEYGKYYQDFLKQAATVTDAAYNDAKQKAADFAARFRAVLSTVDAVAAPGGGVPFPLAHEIQYDSMAAFEPVMHMVQVRFTFPSNIAGTPTLSMPCGFSSDGLPHTIQFLAGPLGEPLLCRLGHAYEQATEWHRRHPNV